MRKKRKSRIWILVLLLLAGAVFYLWQTSRAPNADLAPAPEAPPQVSAPAERQAPGIRYPIEESAVVNSPSPDLPQLDESDSIVRDALSGLVEGDVLQKLLRDENVVRHIVVTVDNLPRSKVAARLLPTKPVQGGLATEKSSEGLAIAEGNFRRYTPYVSVAENIDPQKLVSLYVELYPLFQRAYEELGYPDDYFNDRLVAVIDHMLEAPEPTGPILIKQPHILYKYVDPDLEKSSAGHKLMIRMGKDNAARVKKKLREVRDVLTKEQPS
jgi:hypothetical protein